MTFAGLFRQFSANPVADKAADGSTRYANSSEEVTMNWNKGVRQVHRWLSIAFTLAVIANVVAIIMVGYIDWVGLLAVAPLLLLLPTGLWLFAMPYMAKSRSAARAANQE